MPSPIKATKQNITIKGVGSAPTIPIILMVVGLYVAWFAIHYWRDQSIAYPSDPVKAILQGKPLPSHTTATTAVELTAVDEAQTGGSGGNGGDPAPGPAPSGTIQNMARMALGRFGWTSSQQQTAFDQVESREAGWNPKARNASSGALGIAQALGHGNANTAGTLGNEYGGYGLTDAQAVQANSGSAWYQLVWMVNYIHSVYGSPEAAWAHEQTFDWY